MVRIKHAVATRRRKKRVLKKAKGQFGHRSKRYQQAKRSVVKGMTYSYRDRRVKKREFRRLWIIRISAACQDTGIAYSRFMKGLSDAKVGVDRKMLAEIAVHEPKAFKQLVKLAQDSSAKTSASSKKTKAAKETAKA